MDSRLATLDLVSLAAVLAAAVAVRWPNLWLVPAFTDETNEARVAIAIYRGQATPLTNVDPYIGAFWNYLIAAGFWVFGLSPWLPRLLVFAAAVATVGATWWLGRELGGRFAATVAAAFMAASSTHVLVNSHVGWSHSITPLFVALGSACLVRALLNGGRSNSTSTETERRDAGRRRAGPWLVAAGALLGLAVQTHATAALLLPGAALLVLLKRPDIVRTRWAALALTAFVVATINLVIYNVISGGQSFTGGLRHVAGYTGEETGYDPEGYVANLGHLVLASAWILSGAVEKRRFAGESLAEPLLLLYLALAVAGVLWAAWRGRWLPVLLIVPYALVLPLVNPKYEPLLNGRYLTPLLPAVFASLGLAAADVWTASRARAGHPLLVGGCLAIGLAALIGYPLLTLARYEQSTERTNHAVFAAHEVVKANRQPGETVLLDLGLDSVFHMAAGSAFKSMEFLLETHEVPYAVIDARVDSVGDALAERSPRLLLLHRDKTAPLGRSFTLTQLDDGGRGGPPFGVYRIDRRA